MAFMAAIAPYLAVAGTAMTVIGGIQQADSMRAAAAENKKQADYRAGQELAAGQHQAEASRRKSELMLSRAHAVAAASGGGSLDESLATGILGEGEKAAGFDIYESTERAKGLRYGGEAGARKAEQDARATTIGAFGSGLSLMGAGFGKFAPGAPPAAVK